MIATVLALTALLSPGPLPQAPAAQDQEPVTIVGDDVLLQFADTATPAEAMNLERFVRICQELTGKNFTFTQETADLLRNTPVRLLGVKRVPREDFYSFFQIIMIINEFVCSQVGSQHLGVIMIESLRTQARNTVKNNSTQVEPEELDQYADQPATLITTVIHLPNTDVRQLSNSMRTMLTDANTQQMIPAGSTNSMILTGFGSNVVALARMLELVDEASKTEVVVPEIELIPLEFAAAEEIASTIEELLEAGRRASQGRQQSAAQAQGVTGSLARGPGEAKIMVDPRTNSLLVMAMPEDMPRIKELVARLDVSIIDQERSYHVYSLENVDAKALAETLNEFLQDASRIDPSGTGAGAAAQPNQGGVRTGGRSTEFVVVEDVETNSLLIAANKTRYQELISLIQRLDQRQDQVLIETALIELSGRNFLDIGVELGLADLPGVGETGGFGVTSFGMSTLQDLDGDGVLDTRVPNNSLGITGGILDGDDFNLPLLISLLEERRNSNVLNIPSVLVNNNGSATVLSVDAQPTTTVTLGGGVGGTGTQENFNEYVEAGITMQISPSISASNYLRLDLFLEVSTFVGSVQGSIPPPKVTRTIETSVNIPDGDTMVIGGIIVDNSQKTVNQVPFLGDIPILGHLFKRDSTSQDRTALYFFVTPHIMRDLEFADLADFSFRKKMEAADTIGADRVRQIDGNFGRSSIEDADLRGFDIPIYSSPERGEVDPADVGLENPERVNEMLEEGRAAARDE